MIRLDSGLVQVAQTIVKAVSKTFPFSISLSDAEGYIVGSSDPERIGTFHPVSKKVIEQNRFIAYDEADAKKFDNVLPGIAVPLHFQRKTVGVLGIIGPPKTIRPHAELAKHYVELMWHETYYKQLNDLEEKMEEAYMQYILLNETNNKSRVAEYCRALHLDTNAQAFCIIIDLRNYLMKEYNDRAFSLTMNNLKGLLFSEVKQHFRTRHLMKMCLLNAEKVVLLMTISSHDEYFQFMERFQATGEKLLARLKEHQITNVCIASGRLTSSVLSISESYQDAEQLLQQAEQANEKKQILSNYDWEMLANLLPFKIEQSFADKPLFRLEHFLNDQRFTEVIQSFIAYCEQGMNITEAAKSLYVHRNTVIYRLKRLEEMISIDTKDFQQCCLVYLLFKNSSLL